MNHTEKSCHTFIELSEDVIIRFDIEPPLLLSHPADEIKKMIRENAHLGTCNETAAGFLGATSANEAAGKPLADISIGREEFLFSLLEQFIANNFRLHDYDLVIPRSDGSEEWYLLNMIGVTDSGYLESMWVELRESERRTRAIIDNAPFGMHMYELKPDGRLVFTGANFTADQILGVYHQQFIGKTIEEAFPPLANTVIPDTYRRIAANKETYKQDQINYADGQISGAYEILAFQTSQNHMAVFFTDITERKRAAEELDQYRKRLEELVFERTAELESATQELESFAYSISHDLRSPLRHIDSYTRLLQQDLPGELPEDAADDLKHIRDSVRHMGDKIEGLLSFSRLNRQALKHQHIDPREIVAAVLDELKADLQARNIQITIGELPQCEADVVLIKQVFSNLISNSIKFTRKCATAQIVIGSQEHEQQTAYFVKDNGAGFDMAAVGKLFGVFQRLHPENEYDGIGMGLAIAQRIIHRHGGRIWAQAEVNQGATFYFTLSK